jgi:hypothetical protein
MQPLSRKQMVTDPKTDELRRKMQQLRQSIAVQQTAIKIEVNNLKQTASKALDWKHQLFSHPILVSAVAGVVGFFVVPRKAKKDAATSHESIEKFVGALRQKFDIPEDAESKKAWTSTAFDFMKGYAAQFVISQARTRLIAYLANLAMRSRGANSADCGEFEESQRESYPLHPQ